MRKRYAITVFCALAIASMLLISPAQGRSGYEHVSGKWTYVNTLQQPSSEVNGYIFGYGEEEGIWTGALEGTSFDAYNVIIKPPIGRATGIIFFEGSVGGREGTLEIKFVGRLYMERGLWMGSWVILEGTGELENARGYGTWKGPSMDLDYKGRIRFK